MVPVDSQQIPRARCYSGRQPHHACAPSRTGLITYSGVPSQTLPLTHNTMMRQLTACHGHTPQPHACNPCQVITHTWFSLIRYRSPLHTESHLFSSPTGTEMFHFPASTPTQAMHSPAGNRPQRRLGFPIRTSSDQRLVGNSPRHNAASHVLHRPSMPRHPPYALKQNTLNNTHTHPTTTTKGDSRICAGNTQKRKKKNTTQPTPTPHKEPGN